MPRKKSVGLVPLFLSFCKIGSVAFGGFMALISVVQTEIVERKKLLKAEDMLDGVSLATMLPGPIAVNVVAYVGYRLRGWSGAIVAATGVILPSFILMVILAAAYFRWGQMPTVSKLFLGFIPAVTAIILHAAWAMALKAARGPAEIVIAIAACALLLTIGGFYITLAVILAAGISGWLMFSKEELQRNKGVKGNRKNAAKPVGKKSASKLLNLNPILFAAAALFGVHASTAVKLVLVFSGMSVLLFGGGFVFIPLIQQIVVIEQGWVTTQEFVDAVALGQITPGPILISAAFIGYKVLGLLGAALATFSIFFPPAVLMLISTRFLTAMKHLIAVKAALRGIRAAIIGMVVAAAVVIGSTATPNLISVVIFIAAMVALLKFRIDLVWIIPIAGITGLLFY